MYHVSETPKIHSASFQILKNASLHEYNTPEEKLCSDAGFYSTNLSHSANREHLLAGGEYREIKTRVILLKHSS